PGFCFNFEDAAGEPRGFCTVTCQGYCPESPGEASTFCIPSDNPEIGICASKSEEANGFCELIPGTSPTESDRFLGTDGAAAASATVCAP
ncbi:MAG: hypothetical protein R3324_21670, partial [Halobacteriales archaeon]|nr:hypothetical protein [Halobacteriales archaeon]